MRPLLLLALSLLGSSTVPAGTVDADMRLPFAPPAAVGMSPSRLAHIDAIVRQGITAGGYPGAAVVVGRKGSAVHARGYGTLQWARGPMVDAGETIYDLASLTKVVATTTAAMILYDQGRLQLDDAVARYIPEFVGGGREAVTVRQLLTHHSGLPAGRDLWRVAHTSAAARAMVIQTPITCPPGRCYVYSDLGADLMGFVIEAISGERLDHFLDSRVFNRLAMHDTRYRPPTALAGRIAPTEVSPPRGYPIRGEVHDENAYALGGIAGHAGLFSTASDLGIFAQMMLNGGTYNGVRIVSDSTVALFTRRTAGHRALGWDTCTGADLAAVCGDLASSSAYGHTGYTGTSLIIDPERELFVVLLTNRVHAARARRPAKVIADVRADLADAAISAVVDMGPSPAITQFRADARTGWNAAPKPIARNRSGRSVSRPTRSVRANAVRGASKKPALKVTRGRAAGTAPKSSKASKASRASKGTGRAGAAKGRGAKPASRSTTRSKTRT